MLNRLRQLLSLMLVLAVAGCGPAATSSGAAQPCRIVSMTLGTDELLVDLVPLERIVGVSHFADDALSSNVAGVFPQQVARLDGKDVERLIGLKPDLVCVAPYNAASLLHALEKSGLPTFNNDSITSFNGIEETITRLGQRVGEPTRAQELLDRFRQRRRAIAKQLDDLPQRPRVLYWFSGFTAGSNTSMHDVITSAGAINVGAELNIEGNREISPEQVLAADPDYVLLARWDADEKLNELSRHPILKNLRAVRDHRVIAIDQRYLSSVSHHVLDGVAMLAQRLHSDRFPETGP